MESAPQPLGADPTRAAARGRLGAGPALACLCLAAIALHPRTAQAQAPIATAPAVPAADADRQRMEQQLQELLNMRKEFDKRIGALETELHGASSAGVVSTPSAAPPIQTIAVQQAEAPPPAKWGGFEPGKGLVLMRSDNGELDMGIVSYLRYLNQQNLDKTYTDSFGRTFTLNPRQDFQLAKVQMVFKGWLFNPNFGYNAYVWTSQTSQGLGAQVVAAGNLNYRFNDMFKIYLGIQSLPSTRSTNRTFPYWLRNDNRPIADEFFRGSYTQGIWADGVLAKGLEYRVMLANNLSALGVNAGQLDSKIDTYSGALTWMPTTGEFGPINGFGDFENHSKVATLLGVHYTHSTETPQSQPNTESIENTQLRLSDGTLLFAVNAFNTPGKITSAQYQMLALDAAVKYRGYALEFEYYSRLLDKFQVDGVIPVNNVRDTGFTLQASAMLLPKKLQLYVSGSQIYGKYGDPYDVAVGFNYFPFARRDMRINMMGLYTDHSPVGYTAYPVPVGANGFTFVTDFSLAF